MTRAVQLTLSLLAIFVLACTARAQVVINEILYRPGSGFPENTALEFIELHNPTAATVDVSDWAITSGTSFTIPAGTAIPAGGYADGGAWWQMVDTEQPSRDQRAQKASSPEKTPWHATSSSVS